MTSSTCSLSKHERRQSSTAKTKFKRQPRKKFKLKKNITVVIPWAEFWVLFNSQTVSSSGPTSHHSPHIPSSDGECEPVERKEAHTLGSQNRSDILVAVWQALLHLYVTQSARSARSVHVPISCTRGTNGGGGIHAAPRPGM